MNRVTEHQVLPPHVVRERIKQRLFKFIYEHDDRDFLDVVALLLEHLAECNGASAVGGLDICVEKFLSKLENPEKE